MLLPASVDDNMVTYHSAEHPAGLPPYAGYPGTQWVQFYVTTTFEQITLLVYGVDL